jgi:hypothetical protein
MKTRARPTARGCRQISKPSRHATTQLLCKSYPVSPETHLLEAMIKGVWRYSDDEQPICGVAEQVQTAIRRQSSFREL